LFEGISLWWWWGAAVGSRGGGGVGPKRRGWRRKGGTLVPGQNGAPVPGPGQRRAGQAAGAQ